MLLSQFYTGILHKQQKGFDTVHCLNQRADLCASIAVYLSFLLKSFLEAILLVYVFLTVRELAEIRDTTPPYQVYLSGFFPSRIVIFSSSELVGTELDVPATNKQFNVVDAQKYSPVL